MENNGGSVPKQSSITAPKSVHRRTRERDDKNLIEKHKHWGSQESRPAVACGFSVGTRELTRKERNCMLTRLSFREEVRRYYGQL
jgi:hypothetical protein